MRVLRNKTHPLARFLFGLLAIVPALFLMATPTRPTVKAIRPPLGIAPTPVSFNGGNLGPVLDGTPFGACGSPRNVTFTVSGMSAPLLNVEVSFTFNPQHTRVGDLEVTLIAPAGSPPSARRLLFSRTGATNNINGDDSDVTGPYDFKDSATNHWWTAASGVGPTTPVQPLVPYRTVGPGPLPLGSLPPFTLLTTAFTSLTAPQVNGVWTLRFRDCRRGFVGSVSAATLTLTDPCKPCSSCKALSDFDGDGRNDAAIYRPGNPLGTLSTWVSINSSNGGTAVKQLGNTFDRIVPGDYDGDGVTDYAVWNPFSANWTILYSSGPPTFPNFNLGAPGNIPLPMDYDGDGKVDLAVWQLSTNPPTWMFKYSSNPNVIVTIVPPAGSPADIPVPADYNGDCKADMAVWRPSTGQWFIFDSSGNTILPIQVLGTSGDTPVPADYDGDGKFDLATWTPSTGVWHIRPSAGGPDIFVPFGIVGDKPAPACYDGDGRADIFVYRPSTNVGYVMNSATGTIGAFALGASNDIWVAGAYVP